MENNIKIISKYSVIKKFNTPEEFEIIFMLFSIYFYIKINFYV